MDLVQSMYNIYTDDGNYSPLPTDYLVAVLLCR